MVLLSLLLLLLWPVAELIVIIKVAEAIGVLFTLALLLAGWPLGLWAIRAQGRGVRRRMAAAVTKGAYRVARSSTAHSCCSAARS